MKPETNKLNVSKKQWFAIAVIAAVGIGLGSAILGGKTDKSAEGEGHGSHVKPRPAVMVSIMARQAQTPTRTTKAMRTASTTRGQARAAWRQAVQRRDFDWSLTR